MSHVTGFMMSLPIDISNAHNRLEAVKKQALSTCRNKNWAGLIEMMALSSVIRQTVFSVYPNCSPAIQPFLHGEITPRMGTVSPSNVFYIMWTCDSNLNNEGCFQPNHLVPLKPSLQAEGTKTYAETVKRGKMSGRSTLTSSNSSASPPQIIIYSNQSDEMENSSHGSCTQASPHIVKDSNEKEEMQSSSRGSCTLASPPPHSVEDSNKKEEMQSSSHGSCNQASPRPHSVNDTNEKEEMQSSSHGSCTQASSFEY